MKARFSMLIALSPLLSIAMLMPQSVAQSRNAARETPTSSVQPGQGIVTITRSSTSASLAEMVRSNEQIHPSQRIIISDLLGMLPTSCQDHIQNFYVRYDTPVSRGLAGKDSVIVSGNVPDKEFRALLVHEIFGHVVDLGCLQGTPAAGTSVYWDGDDPVYANDPSMTFYTISWSAAKQRRKDSKESDFVTGYASSADAFEDLAESVTFYFFHREEFRRMGRENPVLGRKFAWIQTYVFPNMAVYARSMPVWNSRNIPWDATKLPYEWTTDLAYRK